MAMAIGLIFSLTNIEKCGFSPTAAAPMLALWFYQRLPLFTYVHYRVGDQLQYAHYGFSVKLG